MGEKFKEIIKSRPFYNQFGWAYDKIIINSAVKRCEFIEKILNEYGIGIGSKILDAGCGTGNYSIELARKGYNVTGIDISYDLLAQAIIKQNEELINISFEEKDLENISYNKSFDGILCRGVLNDIIEEKSRLNIFQSFDNSLRKGGILIFDVRDWDASERKNEQNPIFKKKIAINQGILKFMSETSLDKENQLLLVKEIFNFKSKKTKEEINSEFDFVMRCSTQNTLENYMYQTNMEIMNIFTSYSKKNTSKSSDKLVVVCKKNE